PQAPKCGQNGSIRLEAGSMMSSRVPRSPSAAISTCSPGSARGTKTLRPSISATPSPLWPRLDMVVMVMNVRSLLVRSLAGLWPAVTLCRATAGATSCAQDATAGLGDGSDDGAGDFFDVFVG